MRFALLLLVAAPLIGCTSTRTIQATWDGDTAQLLNDERQHLAWVEVAESRETSDVRPMVLGALAPQRFISADSLLLGAGYSSSDVRSIALAHPRDAAGPFWYGAAIGALGGLGFVAFMNSALCEASHCSGSPTSTRLAAAGVGGAVGGLLALGFASGPSITVYRFPGGSVAASGGGSSARIRVVW